MHTGDGCAVLIHNGFLTGESNEQAAVKLIRPVGGQRDDGALRAGCRAKPATVTIFAIDTKRFVVDYPRVHRTDVDTRTTTCICDTSVYATLGVNAGLNGSFDPSPQRVRSGGPFPLTRAESGNQRLPRGATGTGNERDRDVGRTRPVCLHTRFDLSLSRAWSI